jgi:hypothetical protein
MTAGDLVLIHVNPAATDAGTNPDSETETQSKNEFPFAMFPANADNAWDVRSTSTGLANAFVIAKVVGANGVLQDAVPFYANSPYTGFTTDLAVVQDAGEWSPRDCNGVICETADGGAQAIMVPVAGIGSTSGGNSVRRATGGTDTNTKADWSVGTSSWGAGN